MEKDYTYNIMKIMKSNNQSGFTLVVLIVVSAILVALSASLVVIINNQGKSSVGLRKKEMASSLSQTGLQRALLYLQSDNDWSDNNGILYDNVSFLGGTYSATLSEASTHDIKITVQSEYSSHYSTVEKVLNRTRNAEGEILDSYYMQISTDYAYFNNKDLKGITITNTHPTRDITITGMTVAWITDYDEEVQQIKIDNIERWHYEDAGSPLGLQPSGTFFDIVDHTILASDSNIELKVQFLADVSGKDVSIYIKYSDDSSSSISCFSSGTGQLQSDSLRIDVTEAELKIDEGKNKYELKKVYVINSAIAETLYIDGLTASWIVDNPENQLISITEGKNEVWSGNSGSGTYFNATDFSISSTQRTEMKFYFDNNNIDDRLYTFDFLLTDQSSKNTAIEFREEVGPFLQSSYLVLDVSSGLLSNSDKTLEQLYLQNNHSTNSIYIDKMKIVLQPDTGQKINSISINSSEVYSGPGSLNTTLNITLTELTTIANFEQQIVFDSAVGVDEVTFNFTYEMQDSTVKTNSLSMQVAQAENGLFSVVTRDVAILPDTTKDYIRDLILSSTSPATGYTITHIQPSWTPYNSETVSAISIDGTSVWSTGGASSGTLIDITDHTINAGDNVENIFQFNSDMTSIDFDLEYTFQDDSTANVQIVLNPESWIAGDNFESGLGLLGGYNFSTDWIEDAGDVKVETKDDSFSGGSYLLVKKASTAIRGMNLSGYSSIKMRMFRRVRDFNDSDEAYFEVSDDNENSWDSITTWTADDESDSYSFQEFDLSGYDFESYDFYFRIRNTAGGKNDNIYIDEMYFFD